MLAPSAGWLRQCWAGSELGAATGPPMWALGPEQLDHLSLLFPGVLTGTGHVDRDRALDWRWSCGGMSCPLGGLSLRTLFQGTSQQLSFSKMGLFFFFKDSFY